MAPLKTDAKTSLLHRHGSRDTLNEPLTLLCCAVLCCVCGSRNALNASLTRLTPLCCAVLCYAVFCVLQSGLVDAVAPSSVGGLLQKGLDWLRQHNPQVCLCV